MILSYKMFLKENPERFRLEMIHLEKKYYPTSIDGLVRLGLDVKMASGLKAWTAENGLEERISVGLFIQSYLLCEGIENYVGKIALASWLDRRGVEPEVQASILEWTKGALTAANAPSEALCA